MSVQAKGAPLPPAKAKAIVESFKEVIVEYHEAVGGRVTAIHDLFNQIAMCNKRPPIPPQAVAMLLAITKEQSKPQPGGPTVTPEQTLAAFAHMVEPSDTEESFDTKVVTSLRDRLARLKAAQAIFPAVKDPLTNLHTKVEGDTGKLYAWFERMLPDDVKTKLSKEIFCAMVMHVPANAPKIPLEPFLNGIENNMDETDTAEKIISAVDKALAD